MRSIKNNGFSFKHGGWPINDIPGLDITPAEQLVSGLFLIAKIALAGTVLVTMCYSAPPKHPLKISKTSTHKVFHAADKRLSR